MEGREKVRSYRCGEEGYVKAKAEIGVICLQAREAKDCQQPAGARIGKGHGTDSPSHLGRGI